MLKVRLPLRRLSISSPYTRLLPGERLLCISCSSPDKTHCVPLACAFEPQEEREGEKRHHTTTISAGWHAAEYTCKVVWWRCGGEGDSLLNAQRPQVHWGVWGVCTVLHRCWNRQKHDLTSSNKLNVWGFVHVKVKIHEFQEAERREGRHVCFWHRTGLICDGKQS